MRLNRRHVTPLGKQVSFLFDGEPIDALAGESIAAAMAASGRPALRQAEVAGSATAWRGLWCGMGSCYDCVVTIDGRAGQRACLAKVRGGEVVRSTMPQGTPDDPLRPLAPAPAGHLAERRTDVLVIGAGPAGLAAALAARRAGANVLVLDERSEPGGQYYKPIGGAHGADVAPDRQFQKGRALVEAVQAAGVELVANTMIWGADTPDEVLALIDGLATRVHTRALVLATGAMERSVPLPGWTLPGVMTTGAAQTLSRMYQVAPGRRVVVAGNGPLNLQLAADLVDHGVSVAAVIESAARPSIGQLRTLVSAVRNDAANMVEGARLLATLKRAGVPLLWAHAPVRAVGNERIEAVEIAGVSAGGLATGPVRSIEADALCLGYGFVAATELAASLGCALERDARHLGTVCVATSDNGATSVPGVYAVGDGARVGGAVIAETAGAIAGAAAASGLGFTAPQPPGGKRRLAAARRFQSAIWALFSAPPVNFSQTPDETLLCRCESLTFGDLRHAMDEGAASIAVLKRRTRLGMGRCQGRVCTAVAARLLAERSGPAQLPIFAPRLPIKPFPAAALALEKPEWGGHRRAGTPNLARPLQAPPCPPEEVDVVVIGGGVVGACLAHELVSRGFDTLVVERDDINLQASGANAGSLHVQLLSFDFGAKAEAGGGPAAATLPLGPWSVGLWEELAEVCGHNFEIHKTGGLMVASTDAGMAFLAAKAALERRHGIAAEILDAADLARLAPNLSPALIGAEYVADEGKINPLTATYSVLARAMALGARLRRSADVTALTRTGSRWTVETSRGPIRGGRVVNAAGPWAGSVASLAGVTVPVASAPLQMVVTERAPNLVEQLVAHADRHLSLKQLASGGLVIGGAWPGHYDAARNINRTMRESVEGNVWVAREVLPQLEGLHVLRTWAGMNVNIDGAPIIGEAPGAPGFFNCVTSNGYTLAPAVARLTAELIAHGRTDRDIRPYLLERFG